MNVPKTVRNKFVQLRRVGFNKYGIVFIAFVIWMLFFDSKNVFVQYELSQQIKTLEADRNEYVSKYEDVMNEKRDLERDIEKFAREKYFMHKDNEVVYIVK